MKTAILILILSTTVLTSCKKDHVCQCYSLGEGTYSEVYHDTKHAAKQKCEVLSVNAGMESWCKLK